jgi:glutamate 5-kinase
MRIVYKIGSRLLTDERGVFDYNQVETIVNALAETRRMGHEIVVVCSGAVAAGMGVLGLEKYPSELTEKQATAAIGQIRVVAALQEAFAQHKLILGQVLLTRGELADRRRFVLAKNTIQKLLSHGAIPVVNENDTVAIDELIVGDNDQLAALVSFLAQADLCVLLTDVEGVLRDPSDATTLIPEAKTVEELEPFLRAKKSIVSTGGMTTKLLAAKMNQDFGIETVIASGIEAHSIIPVAQGKAVGTRILASVEPQSAWRHWILHGATDSGEIEIDDGARKALEEKGSSLLAKGICTVRGDFSRGASVRIVSKGRPVGSGLVQYGASDIQTIRGLHSSEIENALGYENGPVVIHRNDLVLQQS